MRVNRNNVLYVSRIRAGWAPAIAERRRGAEGGARKAGRRVMRERSVGPPLYTWEIGLLSQAHSAIDHAGRAAELS